MTKYQLTGSYGSIVLSPGYAYGNPLDVTATGTVNGGSRTGLTALTYWQITNSGTISGGVDGVQFYGNGLITNVGAISGGSARGDAGVAFASQASSSIVANLGGMISGYNGVVFHSNGDVENLAGGTIFGGHAGIYIDGYDNLPVSVGNGTSGHTALISGGVGISTKGSIQVVVYNWGTIEGTAGISVDFQSAGDELVDEPGSVLIGNAEGGGGTLSLADGTGTIGGLGVSFSGFGTYLVGPAGDWTLTGENTLAGRLTNAGTLAIAEGASLTVSGAIDSDGKMSLAENSTLVLTDRSRMSMEGAIANSGVITLAETTQTNNVTVGAAGATLSGGGSVVLGLFHTIKGAVGTATLTNVDNTISGGGLIGAGRMELVNEEAGLIEQTGVGSLTIATGGKTIINAGTIEATGSGGLLITSVVANTGVLEADGANLTVLDKVAGSGSALITGGTLTFEAGFSEAVAFTGPTGQLDLADAVAYLGTISGFAGAGMSLDLGDVGFVSSSEATFSGTKVRGVLTVTDGTNIARIRLIGDYDGATFAASSDGHGGVIVVETGPLAAATAGLSTHAMVTAMAALAPAHAALGASDHGWRVAMPSLVAPRIQQA